MARTRNGLLLRPVAGGVAFRGRARRRRSSLSLSGLAAAASRIPRAQPLVSAASMLDAMMPGLTATTARRGRMLGALHRALARARANLLSSRRTVRRLALALRASSTVLGRRFAARRVFLAYRDPYSPLGYPAGLAAPSPAAASSLVVPAGHITPELTAALQAVLDLAYAPVDIDLTGACYGVSDACSDASGGADTVVLDAPAAASPFALAIACYRAMVCPMPSA